MLSDEDKEWLQSMILSIVREAKESIDDKQDEIEKSISDLWTQADVTRERVEDLIADVRIAIRRSSSV